MRHTRRTLVSTVLGSVLLLTTACSESGDGTPADNPAGTFAWSFSVAISSMDPTTTPNVYDYGYLWPAYDRLTRLDNETGEAEPMLATSWSVPEDGGSITFELREDVTFHDGTTFDAEAVKANIERMIDDPESTVRGQLANVAGVQVDGDHTVTITMKGATAGPMAEIFGGFPGMMVSPAAFDDPDLQTTGAGTGPYRVTSNDGDTVLYERFDEYYDEAAQTVGSIVATALPDDQTRLNAVVTDEVQAAFVREGQLADAEAAGLTIVSGLNPTPIGIDFNMTRAEFDDVRVRQAISLALDREAIATAAFGAGCAANQNLFAEDYWAYDAETAHTYEHDVDKARSLMAEAGLEDGFGFEITSPNIPTYVTMVTAIQDQLEEINVDVEINVVAGAAGNARFWVERKSDALVSADPFLIDPSQMVQQYFGPGGLRNVADHDDPELNRLAAQGLASTDQTERAGFYRGIQQIVTEDALNPLVICNQEAYWALAPGVDGFVVASNGMWDYSTITVPRE